jgi:hypothetical protein
MRLVTGGSFGSHGERNEPWFFHGGTLTNTFFHIFSVTGGIELAWVATIDELSAAIVGFPWYVTPVHDKRNQRVREKIPSYFRRGRSPQGLRGW